MKRVLISCFALLLIPLLGGCVSLETFLLHRQMLSALSGVRSLEATIGWDITFTRADTGDLLQHRTDQRTYQELYTTEPMTYADEGVLIIDGVEFPYQTWQDHQMNYTWFPGTDELILTEPSAWPWAFWNHATWSGVAEQHGARLLSDMAVVPLPDGGKRLEFTIDPIRAGNAASAGLQTQLEGYGGAVSEVELLSLTYTLTLDSDLLTREETVLCRIACQLDGIPVLYDYKMHNVVEGYNQVHSLPRPDFAMG